MSTAEIVFFIFCGVAAVFIVPFSLRAFRNQAPNDGSDDDHGARL
ncbi:hypothetical protein [Solicola sp. PLA-1-18]